MHVSSPRPAFTRIEAAVVLAIIALGFGLLIPQVQKVRESAARARCNISQIGLAFHNYQDAHGKLPPATVTGEDGTPLLSWRVSLLPYISDDVLYREFRPDEPWDGPHNARLLHHMPKIYGPPWREGSVPPHHAVLLVYVGPSAAFEGREGLNLTADFPDGTSNTLLFVEAGGPTPWTKPDDIPFGPDHAVRQQGLFRDGFRASWADGSRRFVRAEVDDSVLRAVVTRNGGEQLPPDW
jgi:hypothetical protein